MVLFVVAADVPLLFIARAVQGVATGIAAGALSAWILDLQPPSRPRFGSLVAAAALVGGLGVGALFSGALISRMQDPLHGVFWLLLVVFVVSLLPIALVPDAAPRNAGWTAALLPRIGVPAEARWAFVSATPSMVAVWAVGGFYLALGPSLAAAVFGRSDPLAGGWVIACVLVTAGVAAYMSSNANARRALVLGSVVLAVGVIMSLAALATNSFAGFVAGSVVTGIGFGPAYSAILRSVAPLAPIDRRGALLAALYVEVYLSFSLPTVAAGFAAGAIGLTVTAYVYGGAVVVLALVTTVLAISRPS